ncbi:hemin uptake protein HemP [Geoalkalibacter halelectricus]|uniref:hemin uptake protein HemP n=1 Tax=Geoalkalibacter halelectricus TaxID=2847045 RepID=UPI00266E9256|nr:hemin uptake protein HemP [Geoalkalibacter halelectricus]MDO3380318.1 hemin uptake protein HemP [Geoalkalibacter halelectricus]
MSTSTQHSAEDKGFSASFPRKKFTTQDLMGNSREVVIEHGGEEYRLRITSNQKLILTK